jgi:hypothetical protein
MIHDSAVTTYKNPERAPWALGNFVVPTDPRLTDARVPLTHSHVVSDVAGLQAALDALTVAIALASVSSGGVADGDKGDITVSASGATWTIDPASVTYAKMQDVSAISTLLGRGDSGVGSAQEITLGTNLSMAGTTLNASGGGSVADGDKGDITVSGTGTVWTVDAAAITDAKLRNSLAGSVIGRSDMAAAGVPADIQATRFGGASVLIYDDDAEVVRWAGCALDEVLISNGSWMVSSTVGTATLAANGVTYAKMQDVSAVSKLLGRGSAAGVGDPQEITLGTNLSMAGTTLNAAGGGAASITEVTVTVPYGTLDKLVAIADASVTAASKILLSIGTYSATSTNDPSDAYFSVEGIGVGTFNVRARSRSRERIGGPFQLNYILG